ncbi:hypothetical protein JW758_01140 [Candidatus Peregrinibacteria bacterium]|nr:hypothetical protein [Candidatus Peregrinibacteria bacterium]
MIHNLAHQIDEPENSISDISDIELALNSGEFSVLMQDILDYLDPQDVIKPKNKKSNKPAEYRVDDDLSYKRRNDRAIFYSKISDSQLGEVVNFLVLGKQRERFMHLFDEVSVQNKGKIIKSMLNLIFNQEFSNYPIEITAIRRKVAKGYVQSAKTMQEAMTAISMGNTMKAILYINENPKELSNFIDNLLAEKKGGGSMKKVLEELFEWIPQTGNLLI